jgi:hypothetical protein
LQLLRDLLIVTGQFRSNQGETREFFYKTVRQAVGSFVAMVAAEEDRRERQSSVGEDEVADGDAAGDEAWQQHLSVLRTLAAAGPGNIRAAEAIAASAASAVIRAAGERTGDLLQLHQTAVEKRCAPASRTGLTNPATDHATFTTCPALGNSLCSRTRFALCERRTMS